MNADRRRWIVVCVLICVHLRLSAVSSASPPYLLHLPGIGGHLPVDDSLLDGLCRGGVEAEIEIYDWTAGEPGLVALTAYDRNQRQSQMIADKIAAIRRADPHRRIIVTCASAGAGLAVWALEKLPDDVHIDTLLMLAPALSPQYDLSKSLSRVTGKAYMFSSTLDPILGFGTRNFGTIDRINTDAAGRVGFVNEYANLVHIPYDSKWIRYGNIGDHIGTMHRPFARQILAPLLNNGTLPTTQPTPSPSGRGPG